MADGFDDDRLARRRQQRTDLSTNIRLFPTPGPKLYTAVVWWAFGLYALFMASAPLTPSPEAEQQYSDLMQQAVFSPEAREAQLELQGAQRHLDEVHVFGWRWREPYSRLVPPRQAEVDKARARLEGAIKEREAIESEAKATVGIWSQYGVDEVRERFWTAYQNGKDFAKRMSWWDVMFGIGGGRDEEIYVTLLRWLGRIMMNFTIGLLSALFSFMVSLVYMIWEYKTSYLSGLLFFAVAMSGASAMVATFIGGMYAVAAGGVYTAIQSAGNARRLEGGRAARQQQVRYQQYAQQQQQLARRPQYEHYD